MARDLALVAVVAWSVGLILYAAVGIFVSLRLSWIPATALGMSAGLALGAAAVGYRTSLPDLVLMGILNGFILGLAQALALPRGLGRRRWIWAAAMPALWGLGWTVTTLAKIAVDQQFIVFGASGALVVTGLLLNRLLPTRPFAKPTNTPTTAKTAS